MFVGKDVATSLGYAKPQNALATHVDKEDKSTAPIQGTAYETRVTLINESGLYALILSSKLPQAKAFKRWVTNEVLPQIRKMEPAWVKIAASNFRLGTYKDANGQGFAPANAVTQLHKVKEKILETCATIVCTKREILQSCGRCFLGRRG